MFNVVNLSRFQFALTAMFHFLFVPLTIGMSFIIAIMETIYVLSKNQIYKNMTKFWGKIFTINFALGVATGITMEFQFGTNWSYFSYYVGDIFGAPLAIEGLMAFFLESTFIGLFIFGWDRLSKIQHLVSTWLLAIGSSFSALWIIVANGWMQNPVASKFNFETMRMEIENFFDLILNPISQVKFAHTIAASYCTGAFFIIGVSSYYLLRKENIEFSKKSFAISSIFGLFSIIFVIILGDESGYKMGNLQKTKLAAIEAEWNTESPPASFSVFAFPSQKDQKNYFSIKIPYLLGIISTRSITDEIIGLKDIIKLNEIRIRNGIKAYKFLEKLKNNNTSEEVKTNFNILKKDLGYGLLLKKYTNDITKASEQQILKASRNSIPLVLPLYFSFRIMVLCGFIMLILFSFCFLSTIRGRINQSPCMHKIMIYSIPTPWIAIESGWFVSEYGRQPWAINDILPTFIANSALKISDILFSTVLICTLYVLFLVSEMYLIIKFIKLGPNFLLKNSP